MIDTFILYAGYTMMVGGGIGLLLILGSALGKVIKRNTITEEDLNISNEDLFMGRENPNVDGDLFIGKEK